MRTINIFLLGGFDEKIIKAIARLDFSSWTSKPVATEGLEFVSLKPSPNGAWLTFRAEDEALLKFLRDFEHGYEPSVDYLSELELSPELQEEFAIADGEGMIQ
jgi:hypothetical protein